MNKGIRLDPPGGEEYIPFKFIREKNNKRYELSNHLGNVLAVVSDQKEGIPSVATNWFADYYDAKVVSANDYYPFGMAMPGRTHSSPSYRYGFNGKEKDESGEWGELTHYDYGFRIYNAGIGRFLSVDPLTRGYPHYTPYQFAGNKPIIAIDLDGLEEYFKYLDYTQHNDNDTKVETGVKIAKNVVKGLVNIFPYLGNLGNSVINEGASGPIKMVNSDLDKLSVVIAEDMIEAKQSGEFNTGGQYLISRAQEPEVIEQGLIILASKKLPAVAKSTAKYLSNISVAIERSVLSSGIPLFTVKNWNWTSTPTFGHTFIKHGKNKTIQQLRDMAKNNVDQQIGQWLDHGKAAEFIRQNIQGKEFVAGKPYVFEGLPEGVGQIVGADGSIIKASKIKFSVNNQGKISANPVADDFVPKYTAPAKTQTVKIQ